jgi:predicted outer membrane protein
MKHRNTMCLALGAVMALAINAGAFAQTTEQSQTTTTTTTPNGTSQQTTTTTTTTALQSIDLSHHLSVGDKIFLMDLVHTNALEIELSKKAYHMAWSKGVSDYAKMMIDDHEALQNQLMSNYGNAPWMIDWQHSLRQNPVREDVGMSWYNQNGSASYSTTNYLSTGNNTANNGSNYDNWMYLDASDWDKVHYLDGQSGFTFDKVYVEDMVQGHHALQEEIWRETQTTTNTDMQSLLTNVAPTVQHHIEQGRMISYNYDDPTGIARSNPWLK